MAMLDKHTSPGATSEGQAFEKEQEERGKQMKQEVAWSGMERNKGCQQLACWRHKAVVLNLSATACCCTGSRICYAYVCK